MSESYYDEDEENNGGCGEDSDKKVIDLSASRDIAGAVAVNDVDEIENSMSFDPGNTPEGGGNAA